MAGVSCCCAVPGGPDLSVQHQGVTRQPKPLMHDSCTNQSERSQCAFDNVKYSSG